MQRSVMLRYIAGSGWVRRIEHIDATETQQ